MSNSHIVIWARILGPGNVDIREEPANGSLDAVVQQVNSRRDLQGVLVQILGPDRQVMKNLVP